MLTEFFALQCLEDLFKLSHKSVHRAHTSRYPQMGVLPSKASHIPMTCCASSVQSASRATLDLSARSTAGKVLRASEILLSKMQLMQLRNTSSRRAELLTACRASFVWELWGPMGTIRGCTGRREDNLRGNKPERVGGYSQLNKQTFERFSGHAQ